MFKKVYKVLVAGQSYDENGNPIVSLLATFDTLEEAKNFLKSLHEDKVTKTVVKYDLDV